MVAFGSCHRNGGKKQFACLACCCYWFLSGAAFLWLADRILPHAHFFAKEGEVEGIPTNWRRSILLVFSITLHNIPEGLAVGVAFGAAANSMSETGLLAAVAVALGIGIQNFPEGAAVSIPLRREGVSRMKKFLCMARLPGW